MDSTCGARAIKATASAWRWIDRKHNQVEEDFIPFSEEHCARHLCSRGLRTAVSGDRCFDRRRAIFADDLGLETVSPETADLHAVIVRRKQRDTLIPRPRSGDSLETAATAAPGNPLRLRRGPIRGAYPL